MHKSSLFMVCDGIGSSRGSPFDLGSTKGSMSFDGTVNSLKISSGVAGKRVSAESSKKRSGDCSEACVGEEG